MDDSLLINDNDNDNDNDNMMCFLFHRCIL